MNLLELLTKPHKYDIEIEDNLYNFTDGYGYFVPGYIKVMKAIFKFNIINIIEEYIKENIAIKKYIDKGDNFLYITYYINNDEICIEYIENTDIYILYFHHDTLLYKEYIKSKLEKLIKSYLNL